jgi:hypothetical protein
MAKASVHCSIVMNFLGISCFTEDMPLSFIVIMKESFPVLLKAVDISTNSSAHIFSFNFNVTEAWRGIDGELCNDILKYPGLPIPVSAEFVESCSSTSGETSTGLD